MLTFGKFDIRKIFSFRVHLEKKEYQVIQAREGSQWVIFNIPKAAYVVAFLSESNINLRRTEIHVFIKPGPSFLCRLESIWLIVAGFGIVLEGHLK